MKKIVMTFFMATYCFAAFADMQVVSLNELTNAKIEEIITRLKEFKSGNILRTANAISIGDVQIILRLYKNISEIIHGFDVDCACVAFDFEKIWLTPRAYFSLKYMLNFIDFDRMSPSYEFRLSKYMKRGFSVYIPGRTTSV